MPKKKSTKPTKSKAPAKKISQDDLRREITNKIVESLKAGVTPWRKPWTEDSNCGTPTNIVSKKRYSGINPLLLEITALQRGYKSRWWGTYNQFLDLGGQVKKRPADVPPGEWGTPVVFYKILEVDDTKKDGTPCKRKIFFLRNYTVFNLEQVEGDKLDKYRPSTIPTVVPANVLLNWEPAEKVITATGAKITYGGNRAVYTRPSPEGLWPNHTGGDYIMVPKQGQFADQAEFFITQFHELMHWTEVRLGWKGEYAMGELVAEIGACYLAAETQVPNRSQENHDKYLGAWLKKMEDDPKWIFHASTQASKGVDFILAFSQGKKNEVPDEGLEPVDAAETVEQAA